MNSRHLMRLRLRRYLGRAGLGLLCMGILGLSACGSWVLQPASPRQVYLAPGLPFTLRTPSQVWAALDKVSEIHEEKIHANEIHERGANPLPLESMYEVRFEFPDRQATNGKQTITGLLNSNLTADTLELVLLTPLAQRLAHVVDKGTDKIESDIVAATRLNGAWLLALWQVMQFDSATLTPLLAQDGLRVSGLLSDPSLRPGTCHQHSQYVISDSEQANPNGLARIKSCRSATGGVEAAQIELLEIGVKIDVVHLAPLVMPANSSE